MTLQSALVCALASCSSAAAAPEASAGTSIDQAAPDGTATSATAAASAYFSIRADLRKCAYPMCGGWFLSRVNSATTQCHDGTIATSCYTPVLDWTNSGLDDTQQAALSEAANHAAVSPGVYAIVVGRFARTNTTTPDPTLGRFVISQAWVAEGDGVSSGTFVKVQDNGLRCFAAPCPNLTETTLNTPQTTDIAEVDWTPSGLTEAQIEDCTQDMYGPDGLVIAGDRYTTTVNGTAAQGRTVTDAYQRLVPQPQ
ncbi:MAG TPA: DUF6748 domain-containing protein [Kofleriaceae bacterium]